MNRKKATLPTTFGILTGMIVICVAMYLYFGQAATNMSNEFIIRMDSIQDTCLIQEKDVRRLLEKIKISSKGTADITLDSIERKLKEHHFIKEAEVSRDLIDNLVVEITQEIPIARLISRQGRQAYISASHKLLPLSTRYTARVLVITGNGVDTILDKSYLSSVEGLAFIEFINYINSENLWRIQFAQIDIDKQMQMIIFPQIGKQKIYFGSYKNLTNKLERLKIFYEKIVAKKGWDTYKIVDLRYKNQLICK